MGNMEDSWIDEETGIDISEQTTTPKMYKEMMKYFAIIRLLNGIHPVGIKGMVNGVAKFLVFSTKNGSSFRIEQLTPSTASQYKRYLDELSLSEATKSSLWQSVHVFLKEMNGFENKYLKNPFFMNPYMEYKRHAYKYIPEDIAMKAIEKIPNEFMVIIKDFYKSLKVKI
jgi:hypothetical protein